jgi:acetoin:2,6-dichlorophenolindophenol oxidoreductase subunit alpha
MASMTMARMCPPSYGRAFYGRDCIEVAMRQLVENQYATVDEILAWQEQFAEEVQRAVAQAQQEAVPDPYREDWTALATRFPLTPSLAQ